MRLCMTFTQYKSSLTVFNSEYKAVISSLFTNLTLKYLKYMLIEIFKYKELSIWQKIYLNEFY